MRCAACHALSRSVICPACETRLFRPAVSRRLIGTLEVVSLFNYSVIEPFLLSKHRPVGYRIYRWFGRSFLNPFFRRYAEEFRKPFSVVSIDDHVRHGYAHTALLARGIRHREIHHAYGALPAQHPVTYAGKSLEYRLAHPRDFRYKGPTRRMVVLLDDVVTTGLTLQAAQRVLETAGVEVLFAVTLADAAR